MLRERSDDVSSDLSNSGRMMEMLKTNCSIVNRRGLNYIRRDGKLIEYNPWLGNHFGFVYDFMMKNNVFPKTFGGSIEDHNDFLNDLLGEINGLRILELGTGTGSTVAVLNNSNQYTGVDISPELLRKARKRLVAAGFENPELYVTSADDLPFRDRQFDLCLCVLSLNFFPSAEDVIKEVSRVLVPGGRFICCVPVPERNRQNRTISGTLYPEKELRRLLEMYGMQMFILPFENGPLLYFQGVVKEKIVAETSRQAR
jgi:ubiquinone/menaquinone biosynthesis C-methylase UbiE